MARTPLAGAHPCPRLAFTILPEACQRRQDDWKGDPRRTALCLGPDCTRFNGKAPAPPEAPKPPDEIFHVNGGAGRAPTKKEEPAMNDAKKAENLTRACATCGGPVKGGGGTTGLCRPCAARANHAAFVARRKKGRGVGHLTPGPAEGLFERASDGAVLDRHGHKHHRCPGKGCTRWISMRSAACPSCAKRGVPRPKLTAVLKAGHAAVKAGEERDAPTEIAALKARVERLEAALFRLGVAP